MTKVEATARDIQHRRILAAVEEAASFDISRARDALLGSGMTATSLVVFATLRALAEDDELHAAYLKARAKLVRERDLEIDVSLNRGFR